ncbi:nucleotidyl transferase AbiEii/AbiGii toxin family protein [Amedibacterium intestinale]|uniref:Abortive infection protein n=3 Tax=Amedibacterium intestinale TaxID=2583452 RepID=A0A6N4TJU7_9FIRM|nr:nucleotidyl transferase AbiEii/AbiGii toxin family protein [Amedibacterium intestinale]RHO20692.1 nucleotidyl transferase AbiEii/AbiGii toxin family protein [Eubacterium sp. AM18-26]RHO24389.1 nucleotidyl transferase AbiEii/AbiGii toxin family protein [Eubacterium sp. AM18-10LB-B]RHO33913.1 nucleotidyl transferase AbiEii/AbiGii toxin family protein [Erysipelotrichaceae bacterium AM17-60]BBK23098.1 abortive infection protein [Amedibacterium intestinale]BBK62851.1 abortive infection protein [
MIYRNTDNWKSEIKKSAKLKGVDVPSMQQRFILEEFAKKIGSSPYGDRLILKGGFIVSTLLGMDTRTTRDLDVTCRTTIYDISEMENIVKKVLKTPSDSFFEYELADIKQAQKDDENAGFIVSINARKDNISLNLKIDVSNNTLIYPDAIRTTLPSMFNEEDIKLLSYPLENIIAEKYETTLDRGEFNSRMRDLYDIYFLMKDSSQLVDKNLLADTIIKVSEERGTIDNLYEFEEILEELQNSTAFQSSFKKHGEKFGFEDITLKDVFKIFREIHDMVEDKLNIDESTSIKI